MSIVRPFFEEDIPQVAELRRRVHGLSAPCLDWHELFLSNPFIDEALPPLVCEDGDGNIVGFLGVMPRRMLMHGQPVRVAIATHFMVDSGKRGLVGLQLLKRFMEGPQDLSITDGANDLTRRVWEGRGGVTALLYSMHWTRPLRPAQFTLAVSGKFMRSSTMVVALRPLARAAERLAARAGLNPFAVSMPRGSEEELDEATMLARLPDFAGSRSLRPDYDERSLKWVLGRMSGWTGGGRFQKVLVRDGRGEIAGWYLFYANAGGIGDVLQVVATVSSIHEVLDHLLNNALRQGMIALSGRLDPVFMQEFSDRFCLLHRRGPWTLIHARNPELLEVFHRGEAFLTRLEGEWLSMFSIRHDRETGTASPS